MKRILSPAHTILVLLALASVPCLSAQSLIIDKSSLSFSGQFGGGVVTQTINVTSSTGVSTAFLLAAPGSPWLKFNGQTSTTGSTPSAVTITADPTGLAAGTYSGNITVAGGTANNPLIPVTFTVSAIGVNPASLAFTYTVGSSTFPGTQVLTLSGATTQCTATSTPSATWMSLLNSTCNSPGTVTVLFNTSVIGGLAPNTYTGNITITPAASTGSPAVVVPITLTVLATPPVTVNPTSLVLIWQTGVGAANPTATFTISTTAIAAQPLGYSFSQTGVLTSISTISPSTGTFSAASGAVPITYTVNTAGLAVGTYNGNITLLTSGGSPPQTSIPVTLIVTNTPSLIVPNATLNFTYQLGTNAPASQSVAISATSGNLNYAVSQSANSAWLSVPNAGSTAAPLPVSVNPAGLAAGTYSATVSVVSATPGSAAQQFAVVLKITNDPVISTNVSKLTFPYQIGQSAPATQSVRIVSTTGVPLNYSASLATTTCGSWLLLNNGTNTINGLTDDTLVVSVATAGLTTAATCDGTITITATIPATGAPAVNSPLTIPVKLYVSTTAQLVLAPANLLPFTIGIGSQSPPTQNISLTSTNTDVLNYTVAFQSNTGNWLFVAPQSGTTAANSLLTVNVIPSGLAAGQYTGSITITATGPGGAVVADSPVTIPVTLNVTSVSLTLSSTDLTFQQVLGGPAPASQTVTIGSSGQTVLAYNAVANSNNAVNWLSVSPNNGNTSANGSLTVSVDGSKLTPGITYNGTIVVTAQGAGNSPATINVHLKVDPGTLSAPTTTLTFTQLAGGAAPAAQTIAVTGSPAALNFTVTSSTQNGVNWLGASPASGATPTNVQVTVNGASLAVGQYTGTVTIASTGAAGSPISVPVVLNVVTPGTITATPTTLSFAYIIGQTAPVAQNLAVSSSAAATFTTQVQIDGSGSWLTVTPASGSTPATLVVSVAPTTLAAGNYTGRIVINSPNALTPVTIPVTLTVSAIPKPVVVAIKNAANYFSGNVSPGENIQIGGTGIGPATLTSGAVVNNVVVTTIANTRVLFDGVAAPIIYASDTLTSVMVPYGISGRTSTNVVVEYSGVQSAPVPVIVAAAAPGIYTQNSQGTGPGSILNQNGAINSPSLPEKRGNVITVYMTGEGATNPQGVDGAIIPSDGSGLKKPLATVTATIGGVTADVQYAGSAPGIVSGVMQVNLLIPATAPVGGNIPIVINVGTASSSGAGAPTVAVQ